jgi:hypothetical protein
MAEWTNTGKWSAATAGGGSAGFSVECPATGELGHAKPVKIANELLGYVLSVEAGVSVPVVELGTHNGNNVAVSKMWGPKSMDVMMVQRVSPDTFASAPFREALGNASGLFPYHAWVGTRDIKDAHLMVRPGARPDQYEVAGIDFADAFEWPGGPAQIETAPMNGAAAIVSNRNAEVVAATVARIEAIPPERIREIVNSIPDALLPAADKQRISTGLIARQAMLRGACHQAGWL